MGVTSQFSFCGLPFRLDTYSGCAFNCTYCFARLRGGYNHTKKLRPANPDRIIKKFKNALTNEKQTSIISQYIRRKMPLHFGGMSDPFQPIEKEMGISWKILKFLSRIKYPTIISTKSTLISSPKYLDVIKSNPNCIIQFSLSTTIDENSQISEPYSTSPSDLLKTIEVMSLNNIIATIRWQPFIPYLSESPSIFVKRVASCGIRHIGFEHLKLPVENQNPLWRRLSKSLEFDIYDYYKKNNALVDGRELVLPSDYKLININRVKEALSNYDITLGVADNDLQYLSDSKCCCSGADLFHGFENWNKFQIGYAIKASEGKSIRFSLIKDMWKPTGSLDQHINSDSRIIKNANSYNRVEDYIIERWQNLRSPFNPTRFYNIKYQNELDENGMKIYEWQKSKS